MTDISKIQRACFYIYRKLKNPKHFNIQKFRHFEKYQDNLHHVFIYKSKTLYVTPFFMNILKLAFVYKKHDTLRYAKFYIQKSRHFAKSKTICLTFFTYNNPDNLRYTIFHWIFEICGGEGTF